MDEDEEDDNFRFRDDLDYLCGRAENYVQCSIVTENSKSRTRMPLAAEPATVVNEYKRSSRSSQYKAIEKLVIILFAFVFSNLRWSTYAEDSELFNDSQSAIGAGLRYQAASNSNRNRDFLTDERRIRHDTNKNTPNERIISLLETSSPYENNFFFDRHSDYSDDDIGGGGGGSSSSSSSSNGGQRGRTEDVYLNTSTSTNKTTSSLPKLQQQQLSASTPKYEYNENCVCFVDRTRFSKGWSNLTIALQHGILNTSKGIVAGILYRVVIKLPEKLQYAFVSTENADGRPVGVFYPSHKNCSHVGQIRSGEKLYDSQILLNWSLPTVNGRTPIPKVLFRLCYQVAEHNHTFYEATFAFAVIEGCELMVKPAKGSVSSANLFAATPSSQQYSLNCSLIFSDVWKVGNNNFRKKGLIIKLIRLNVRCGLGYIKFFSRHSNEICGKLEEMSVSQREYYFGPELADEARVVLFGKTVFAFTYELVDDCYNVSLYSKNQSLAVKPLLKIFCNYKISLPFGYRVNTSISLSLNLGLNVTRRNLNKGTSAASASASVPASASVSPLWDDSQATATATATATSQSISVNDPDPDCGYIFLRVWDSNSSKVWCQNDSRFATEARIRWLSAENHIRVRVYARNDTQFEFSLNYDAVGVRRIVGDCEYGSISVNSACVSLVDEQKLNWTQAEQVCVRKGGHLASILDQQSQQLIDQYLIKSPGYQDSNSYWIGASDVGHEGDFRWTDGFVFSYSNWFNGWPLYGYYNRQPNDDGFSKQDCVELRRRYHVTPTDVDATESKARLTATFTWNDRDCRTKNYFLCESFKMAPNFQERLSDAKKECNQKIALNEENNRVVISSPGFPHSYPDNKECLIVFSTPLLYKIVVVFEEFVLEDEPNCGYDYLEIYENNSTFNSSASDTVPGTPTSQSIRRSCGDWSDKLKLLRYVSSGSKLFLHFNSDYSHTFSGFKAHVHMERVKTDCPDNRLQMFDGACFLFVSYPQVTWQTAQDICNGIQANLASVRSMEEHHFIVSKIRESHEYTTSAIYWLGGKFNVNDEWKWIDNASMEFNAWIPTRTNFKQSKINENDACLGIQWVPSPSSLLPSGLYWVPESCQKIGGYVCKIKNQSFKTEVNLNVTTNGTEGKLSSPNYPGNYYHNLDYWTKIISPDNTRIIIQFQTFDLEEQKDCLYDFLEIHDVAVAAAAATTAVATVNVNESEKSTGFVRKCGHHHSHLLHRLNFASASNQVSLRFHSDYSIAGSGFMATWKAVDISSCPVQTLTAREGVVTSPNYPYFLLANLQCTTTILAPVGRQVWLEITDWDFDKKQYLESSTAANSDFHLFLGNKEKLYPLQDSNVITDGVYLSYGEYMRIYLKTGDAPNGKGFKGVYRTVSELHESRVINLRNNSNGQIHHLNFPLNPVSGLKFVQRFVAPLGYSIHVQFHQVVPSLLDRTKGRTVCPNDGSGFIEVRDHYADRNGTWWQFCEAGHQQVSDLAITSYLNSITVKQISDQSKNGVAVNASISVIPDPNFKAKILQFAQDYVLESCTPNPCNNDGKCVSFENGKRCECTNHFTGLFCALTVCDVNPCLFGTCELTADDFKCVCQQGYQGKLCDKKMKPCSTNPCEGRGECVEKINFTYFCQCHAWWEGERCEKKIVNIPYKPLTDRMLEEPFWLGLLTVFVVLSIIGLVWCARRHFPEKLEKLLAEEAERNRHYASSGRSSNTRADTMGQNGVATAVNVSQTNTANSSPNPRTLLGRLGIRKPSLFSLTSPLQPTHTARTFSLDDLFKPSSSRSQMSYKHRNSTGYRKKSIDKSLLKKQSSSVDDSSCKTQQDKKIEIIELKEDVHSKKNQNQHQNTTKNDETSFIFSKLEKKTDKDNKSEINNKYEKKVHFARLMSKVQAEIISSDVDVVASLKDDVDGQVEQNFDDKPLTVSSTQTLIYQPKSPHSTSSNQGSDSLSSSEMTLITASGEKLNSRRPSLLTLGTNGKCQKAASADSILAMFRKFSLSTAPSSECNSNFVSASTSPTISSPPDEVAGSDDSSLSSYPLPSMSSIGQTESPSCVRAHSSTIQVSVLDPLNSQKISSNIPASNLLHPPTILLEVPNKCLSPIHEVPTPSPSPLMTPIMPRHLISSAQNTAVLQDDTHVKNNAKTSENSQFPPSSAMTRANPTTKSNCRTLDKAYHLTPNSNSADTPSSGHISKTQSPSPSFPQIDNNGREMKMVELVIPTFTIEGPSPVDETPTIVLCPSTPPVGRKVNRLQSPPTITVTCSVEVDSDPDYAANTNKCGVGNGNSGNVSGTMVYLSPFSMCSRADRTASESNLSSSGYSSMASPGPSRCGSNNPLCPSEGEDQSNASHRSPRRPSPLIRTLSGNDKSESNAAGLPSDSETLSDDHQMESNDEGFSTDQLDEKIKRGDLKSAKELQLFIGSEQEKKIASSSAKVERCDSIEAELENCLTCSPLRSRPLSKVATSDQHLDNFRKFSSTWAKRPYSEIAGKNDKYSKSSLQLPSIVVEIDGGGGGGICVGETRSPVSSRSESPLSDRTASVNRFSPMYYGRLTDSDGIYDWTSSDCLKPIHRKHFGRRREKHRNKSSNFKAKNDIPTLLDVPGKCGAEKWRKPSPKRRVRSHMIKASSLSSSSSSSSSSSCESTASHHSRIHLRKLHSPSFKIKCSSKSSSCSTAEDVSIDDTTQDQPPSVNDDIESESGKSNIDVKLSTSQRFNIIEKLSSILLNDKKVQRKNLGNDSASVPLLKHSQSVEEDHSDFVPSKKRYSKRGKNYYKSSGLTD